MSGKLQFKAKWLSEDDLQIAEKRREAKEKRKDICPSERKDICPSERRVPQTIVER